MAAAKGLGNHRRDTRHACTGSEPSERACEGFIDRHQVTANIDKHDPAIACQLLAIDVRVVNPLDIGEVLQIVEHLHGGLAVPLHAQLKGLHASAQQPGAMGRQD
ncbi:hypothetical protein D3C75_1098620 [compost metagenome]